MNWNWLKLLRCIIRNIKFNEYFSINIRSLFVLFFIIIIVISFLYHTIYEITTMYQIRRNLKAGIINVIDTDENERTPLFWAIKKEDLQLAEELIKKGSYVNHKVKGRPLIVFAIERKNKEC